MSARILAAACGFFVASISDAQSPTVSGAFISTLGNDTVAVERYTRSGNRLEGEVLTRFPQVQVLRYVADLDAGRFRGMSIATRRVDGPADAPPAFSMITLIGDSSASVEVQRSGRPDTVSTGTRKFTGRAVPAIPGLPSAVGLYEQILAGNQPLGRDSMKLSLLGATPGPNASVALLRSSRDTVVFVSSFNPGWIEVASIDAGGRITSLDATATTVKTRSHRASGVDLDAIARRWALVEAAQGRAGRLSPRDTVRARIGATDIEIAYSRPMKRGRTVWGSVVEWGKPWRTGADAATTLTTSADLLFGTTVVPAGSYTLWSLPTAAETQLIINTQTGQWGTQYDASRDLARFAMRQTMLPRPIERFTIEIAPEAGGAVLGISWDDRVYSIPFRTRR
ncbi:MAG: DUF2911 domain-containing protein [Gemmatimonadaceae bacterium]